MRQHDSIPVSGGHPMPSVGLGLWKIGADETAATVVKAIELGYRHIDAACDYGNEPQAGDGIRTAFQNGLCKRDQLWITSKLWNTYHRPEHVRPAIERSLQDLKLDYLDLYLVHFPISLRHVPMERRYPPGWIFDPKAAIPRMQPEAVRIAETWGAMEELVKSGLCRNIGVSNFGISLIRDLLSYASIRPTVLQVEAHPFLVQQKLLKYCKQEQIAFTAFSPLGAGSYVGLGMAVADESVLVDPTILRTAGKYNKSAAQVILRWGVQRGTSVVPKTVRAHRLLENISIFDFALTADEMHQIDLLDRNRRFNDPGVFCEQAFGCFYPIYE